MSTDQSSNIFEKTAGQRDQSLESLSDLDSASATVLSLPGIKTASMRILRDSHQRTISWATLEQERECVPPDLFI